MSVTISEELQYKKMTEKPVTGLILSLALPTVASMMVTSIYNMADTYFVSQLGTDASGAVGIVFSIQSLIQAIGFGFGMGAGSLISKNLGEKNERAASIYASSAFCASIFFGLIFTAVFSLSLEGMMVLFGSNADILPYACDYGKYIVYSAPIMCSSFVLNNILRAQGMAFQSMVGLTLGGIINIVLDPVFIFILDMGIAGAAIATMVSQIISFCVLCSYFARGKSIIKISPKNISKSFETYFDIVKIGSPTVCRQGLGSLAATILNRRLRIYGSAAIAAVGIANKLYMIVRSLVIGIGQGYQPVAGYNYGAKKYERVKKSFVSALTIGTAALTLASVILFILAPDAIRLFRRDDPEVIKTGALALRYLMATMPFLAYSAYTNMTYQCLGKSKEAAFLASCRNGIFYIPLVYSLPFIFKLDGIILVQPIADVLTFLVSIPFALKFVNELKSKE